MREFIELQSTLKPDSVITDIRWENDRLHFTVDGHPFATAGMYVMSGNHPAFKAILDYTAKKNNTVEGIEEEEKSHKKLNQEFEDYMEYRAELYRRVFVASLLVYKMHGEEAFLKYVDKYLEIMTEEAGMELVQKIKKEKEGK